MQIAVARVVEVGRAHIIAVAHLGDLGQDCAQLAAGHGDIGQHVVGRQTGEGSGRALAAIPDLLSLLLSLGEADIVAAVVVEQIGDLLHLRIEALGVAVDLDNQRCAGVDGQPRMGELLDHAHAALVHQLQRGGNQTGRNHGGDGFAGRGLRFERDHHGLDAGRIGDQAQPGFGHDAQRAFAAHDQCAEIVFGIVDGLSAQRHDLAVGQHQCEAHDVVGGDAIFEAVGAAGVGAQIAADDR